MKSMTVQDRISDISKRCGMSEGIVRRVLEAEQKSIVGSLKRGERATLIGRCVIEPELRYKLQREGGNFKKGIKLKASVTNSLMSELSDVEEFEESTEKEDTLEGVMLMQIPSLT